MSYNDDTKVCFVTLAIGEEYRQKSRTLIESVLKFTKNTLYVITDDPDYYGNFYVNRVIYIDVNTATTLPLNDSYESFNYHLKFAAINYVYKNTIGTHSVIIYVDADTFLFGWDSSFNRTFNDVEDGIYARFRHPLNIVDNKNRFIEEKISALNIDISNIDIPLPVETVLIFKVGPKLRSFLDSWESHIIKSLSVNARSFMEAVEFVLAMYDVNMPYYDATTTHPFVDNFRTLHNGKIHTPFII